jgi:cytochrome c biogenesis protein CcdA
VLQIKDYFWYGKGISLKIPGSVSEKIQYHSKHNKTFIGIGLLGVLVALVELVCTGAPYFAIVAILKSKPLIETTVMLGLYNLIFIIPLAVILVVVASGTKISVIAKWKDESKESTRLYSGILLAGLGWILILIANGTLKIG